MGTEPTLVEGPPLRVAVAANGLGARTRRGWIYRDVDCVVGEGALAAIVGPAGSGRTSLLLAMAARMPFSAGELSVCGIRLPDGTAPVRSRVAVARAGGACDLEPWLRVREHLIERGTSTGDRADRFRRACALLGLTVEPEALVGDLSAVRLTLLCVALAMVDEPRIVAVDDLDRGLSGDDQTRLWERLRALTEDGTTVLAATTDPGPVRDQADVVVSLNGGPS